MSAWPGGLPQTPLLEGLSYSPADQSISSSMDAGPPKRRRRFSVRYAQFDLPIILTGTELATFETFWETTLSGGTSTFTWTDPTTGSTITLQFRAPPRWTPIKSSSSTSTRKWSGVLALERVA